MRKRILPFLASLPLAAFAQQFAQAPRLDRPVKQVVCWQTFPAMDGKKEETHKAEVFTFRPDGNLETWETNNKEAKVHRYLYDPQGRKTKVTLSEKSGTGTMTYTYGEGLRHAEIKTGGLYLKTTQFLNKKGQVVEEKIAGKTVSTDGIFELISRKVLNYNELDSLFGEMEYQYKNGKIAESKKTVHEFDPKTHRKKKTVFYDNQSKIEETVEYSYNENGSLGFIDTKRPGSKYWLRREFRYQDGKLWQEIEHKHHSDEHTDHVYKDGRLVRSKYFLDKELIAYTDFQYVFF